jgi:hypothetical protein
MTFVSITRAKHISRVVQRITFWFTLTPTSYGVQKEICVLFLRKSLIVIDLVHSIKYDIR